MLYIISSAIYRKVLKRKKQFCYRMTTVPLLDGKGCVELLETFGDDLTVVNAARVSFAKESKVFEPRDEKLIQYLASHDHTSPFFHPQIRFRLKMPIYVAREWFRHTVGFSRNEVSRRYVDDKPECFLPTVLRERDVDKKQGSKSTPIRDNQLTVLEIDEFQTLAMEFYQSLLDKKVAPEIARGVLPQSMYTEFIETGSLAAYARLCGLRQNPDAQMEIRVYADAVSDILMKSFPVSWRALTVPSK